MVTITNESVIYDPMGARIRKFVFISLLCILGIWGGVHLINLANTEYTLTIHYHPGLTIEYPVIRGRTFNVNTRNSLDHALHGLTLGDLTVGSRIVGWYYDETLLLPFDPTQRITGNLTLHPRWELNEYTITVRDPIGYREGRIGNEETITLPFGSTFTLGDKFPNFLREEAIGFSPFFLGDNSLVPLNQTLHVTQNMIYYVAYPEGHLLDNYIITQPFLVEYPYMYLWCEDTEDWYKEYFRPEDILVRFRIDEHAVISAAASARFNDFEPVTHNTLGFLNLPSMDGVTPLSTRNGYLVFSHWTLQLHGRGNFAAIQEGLFWESGHFVDMGLMVLANDGLEGVSLYRMEQGKRAFTFVAIWQEI